MNENEQKINRFLFAFVKILEWLTEGAHISKNEIHYIINETTFGPPYNMKTQISINLAFNEIAPV